MAKSQEKGTTILLGLKGYEVGMVTEGAAGVLLMMGLSYCDLTPG